MQKKDKPLTKSALVSMQVIDSRGRLVGKVKDVLFEVGKPGISLYVEAESGETQTIQWDAVQGAADFIVLKPVGERPAEVEVEQETAKPAQTAAAAPKTESAKQQGQPTCPTCGKPLTWVPQYKRWYCYNDKKYVNPEESKNDWQDVFKEESPSTEAAKQPSQASQPLCPTCSKPLTWIPQYKRWYCYNEKKYV